MGIGAAWVRGLKGKEKERERGRTGLDFAVERSPEGGHEIHCEVRCVDEELRVHEDLIWFVEMEGNLELLHQLPVLLATDQHAWIGWSSETGEANLGPLASHDGCSCEGARELPQVETSLI